jgi:Uma2 family endonuclease
MGRVSIALALDEVHRLPLEDYHRLVDVGVLGPDAHVELLYGLIADMSPKTRRHEQVIEWLNERLVLAAVPGGFRVRVGGPLTIASAGSEPEPDLAVIAAGTPRPYHPASAALVIEVAVTSQRRDLVTKPGVYAAAGVSHYWVADLQARTLTVHTRPEDGVYQHVQTLDAADTVGLADIGLEPFSLGELFAAADLSRLE